MKLKISSESQGGTEAAKNYSRTHVVKQLCNSLGGRVLIIGPRARVKSNVRFETIVCVPYSCFPTSLLLPFSFFFSSDLSFFFISPSRCPRRGEGRGGRSRRGRRRRRNKNATFRTFRVSIWRMNERKAVVGFLFLRPLCCHTESYMNFSAPFQLFTRLFPCRFSNPLRIKRGFQRGHTRQTHYFCTPRFVF